jgi:hypothetical protein
MKSRLKPSPAMVVAVISLIVAIGGTAVALPGSLRVGSDDLRKDSVGARALGKALLGQVALISSTDPVAADGEFTELEGSVRCPAWAPFAFDPSISGLSPLAYETNRNVLLNRFSGPGGYEFEVMSDEGSGIAFAMKVNCLARR